jgi:hypothetical protein
VITNAHFFRELRACGAVASAASEEASTPAPLGGVGYSVAFDPLDGSSVLDAGFAVGSIVGIWPGSELVGRTGREQCAACYALFGPRTLMVLATPGLPGGVNEYVLTDEGGEGGAAAADAAAASPASRWRLSREALRVAADSPRVFAPANARAAADNAPYRALLHRMLDAKLTIRYRRARAHTPTHARTHATAPRAVALTSICVYRVLLFAFCPAQRRHGARRAPHPGQGRRRVLQPRQRRGAAQAAAAVRSGADGVCD